MSTKEVFAQVESNVKADPGLVSKINGVYQFNIGDEKWTVDLKNAPGSVKEGPANQADCTLTMQPADFAAMAAGQLNGQNAFMQGKLKINGNMTYAMKLGQLFEAKASGASGGSSASSSDPIATVFQEIEKNIQGDSSLVGKVKGIYKFNVTKEDGSTATWIVDLKNEPGKVFQGNGDADCTMSMKEEDFVDIMTGNVDGQQAFMQGKLRMTGNMGLAMKLSQVVGAKVPKQARL